MKKLLLIATLFITAFSLNAQTTAIPDNHFEQRLIDLGLDTTLDGQVLTSNINTVTTFTINSGSYNPSNLTGIEDFTALENLIVIGRPALTTVDLSNNTNLINVDLTANFNLNSTLDFSNSLNLSTLNVSGNLSLSTLDVSNTNLSSLDVSNTSISTLDVSNNSNLSTLNVRNTNLASLDVSSNSNLSTLDVSNTNLASLDLSANTNLTFLKTSNVSSLDTVKIPISISILNLRGTAITSLDLSTHINLTSLLVFNNSNLTELNLQNGVNTMLNQFNSTATPNLSCIQVDDVTYANTTWNNVDNANVFSTDCTGTAFNFDGIDDYAVAINPSVLDITTGTIEMRTKPQTKTTKQTILGYRSSNGGSYKISIQFIRKLIWYWFLERK